MSTPIWAATAGLTEQPNSPQVERSFEKWSVTRIWKGPFVLCMESCPALKSWSVDGLAVSKVKVEREKGSIGTLTVVSEIDWKSRDDLGNPPATDANLLPPDECRLEYERLDIEIQRHKYFGEMTINEVRAVKDLVAKDVPDDFDVETDVDFDPWQQALYRKLVMGQLSYVLHYPKYVWSHNSWEKPTATAGGYLSTPAGPLTPPVGVDWLRLGDSVTDNGQYYTLTMQWMGGPPGYWDRDLYSTDTPPEAVL